LCACYGRDFGAVAANGNRSFSNDYLVDGVPNNNDDQGVSALPLSIDAHNAEETPNFAKSIERRALSTSR
jgi:hypothetical protein